MRESILGAISAMMISKVSAPAWYLHVSACITSCICTYLLRVLTIYKLFLKVKHIDSELGWFATFGFLISLAFGCGRTGGGVGGGVRSFLKVHPF